MNVILVQRPAGMRPRSATVSTASMKDERILIEGNLHKHGRRFKGWHQRYFRIKGSHLYHYKTAVSVATHESDLSPVQL